MSVADVCSFDSSLPKSEWSKQWLGMTEAQVKEALNPDSTCYFPNGKV